MTLDPLRIICVICKSRHFCEDEILSLFKENNVGRITHCIHKKCYEQTKDKWDEYEWKVLNKDVS